MLTLTTFSSRPGHLCGRPLSALCPLWLGLRVARRIGDNRSVLHGGLQPRQLLVFSQVNTCQCNNLIFSIRGIFINNALTPVGV